MSAVSEIMSPSKLVVTAIKRDPSALDVTKLMIKNKVGSVVLVDGHGAPVGIVTERDLLRVSASKRADKSILAKKIMSSPVKTVKAIDSVETAVALMSTNKIKRLVVLEDDGSCAGVLSATDITKRLAKILTDDYSRYGHLKAILDL